MWQSLYGSALDGDGSIVIVGEAFGDWGGISLGAMDFAAVKLDISDGFTEAWRWQVSD